MIICVGSETVVAFQNRVSSYHKITLGGQRKFCTRTLASKTDERTPEDMRLVSTLVNVKKKESITEFTDKLLLLLLLL